MTLKHTSRFVKRNSVSLRQNLPICFRGFRPNKFAVVPERSVLFAMAKLQGRCVRRPGARPGGRKRTNGAAHCAATVNSGGARAFAKAPLVGAWQRCHRPGCLRQRRKPCVKVRRDFTSLRCAVFVFLAVTSMKPRARATAAQSSRMISAARRPANKPMATAGRMAGEQLESSACACAGVRMPMVPGGTLAFEALATGLPWQ